LKKELLIICSLVIVISGCSIQQAPPESFISELKIIKSNWAPDKRTSVYDIHYIFENGKWIIKGETTVTEVQKAVAKLARKTFSEDEFILDLQLLPPKEYGDTTHALVNVSVGNLRKSPEHSAELVDQVLMGMEVKLIKNEELLVSYR